MIDRFCVWSQTWQQRSRFPFDSFLSSCDFYVKICCLLLTCGSHDRRQQDRHKWKTKDSVSFVLEGICGSSQYIHPCIYFGFISLRSNSEEWKPGMPNGYEGSFLSQSSNWSTTLLTGQHQTHQRTGGWGGCSPPSRGKNSIIRAKLMYCSGKETVKNILLFNILIYLFSPRNSPNLLKLPPSRR